MAAEKRLFGRLARVHMRPVTPPRPWVPWIILTVALLSSSLVTWVVHEMISTREDLQFQTETNRILRAVENRVALYETTLRGGSGFFSVKRTIDFDEFENFYRRQAIHQTKERLDAIGFARRFERSANDSLQRLLTSLYDATVVVSPELTTQTSRYVVTLLAPRQIDERIRVGTDLFAATPYRVAINEAITSGRSRIVQLTENGAVSEQRYLMVNPTWDETDRSNVGPAASSDSVRGMFIGLFRASDLLKKATEVGVDDQVEYTVYDGPVENGNRIFATIDQPPGEERRPPNDESIVASLDIAGDTWTFVFEMSEDFGAGVDTSITPLIFILGLLVSTGLFLLTRSQIRAFENLETSATNLADAQNTLHRLNEELEDRVRDRTAELEASNSELKAFAYSVSHDLRAPLRGIDGFSKFLMEDYGEKLDDTGLDYLQRIRDGAGRMGDIIDNLLMLSRVSRWDLQYEELDLAAVASEIVERLQKEFPQRKVTVEIEQNLMVVADRQLITIGLENMIENAWKFTSRQEEAHIHFSRASVLDPESGEQVKAFVLADDGAGFESQYADKLFDSFRRLHATNDFAGTGIGLATVKRVISRHGGKIWATGEPGVGATFYFTLQTTT